jgi:hypothetical protein
MKRVMRPPNWRQELDRNTRRLQAVTVRVLEETDEHKRFKLFCLADSLLDQRLRLTAGASAERVAA